MRHARKTQITLPELGLIVGTRVILGGGIGLLLADRLGTSERRAVGWTLLTVGALTTIPLAFEVLGGRRLSDDERTERSRYAHGGEADTDLARH
jgi:hypothetical protein